MSSQLSEMNVTTLSPRKRGPSVVQAEQETLDGRSSKLRPSGSLSRFRGNDETKRRIFRRGPWENASAVVIGLGIFMLMQPFVLDLYTYSFDVILAGTLGFLVTSHFPE